MKYAELSKLYSIKKDFFFLNLMQFLLSSAEFMFVYSDGGKRGASWAHPLWSYHVWDHHRCSHCKDTQDTTCGGHLGGEPHAEFTAV